MWEIRLVDASRAAVRSRGFEKKSMWLALRLPLLGPTGVWLTLAARPPPGAFSDDDFFFFPFFSLFFLFFFLKGLESLLLRRGVLARRRPHATCMRNTTLAKRRPQFPKFCISSVSSASSPSKNSHSGFHATISFPFLRRDALCI